MGERVSGMSDANAKVRLTLKAGGINFFLNWFRMGKEFLKDLDLMSRRQGSTLTQGTQQGPRRKGDNGPEAQRYQPAHLCSELARKDQEVKMGARSVHAEVYIHKGE